MNDGTGGGAIIANTENLLTITEATTKIDGILEVTGDTILGSDDSDNITMTGKLNTFTMTGGASFANPQSAEAVGGTLTITEHTTTFAPRDGQVVGGNVIINGNLTVSGATTTVNSNTVNIGDAIMVLNSDLAEDAPASENAGIEIERGTDNNVSFLWDETNTRWTVRSENDSDDLRHFAASTFIGNLSGQADTVGSIADHNTSHLDEHSSYLYHTELRAREAVSGGAGITYSADPTTEEVAAGVVAGQISIADNAITAGMIDNIITEVGETNNPMGSATKIPSIKYNAAGCITSCSEVDISTEFPLKTGASGALSDPSNFSLGTDTLIFQDGTGVTASHTTTTTTATDDTKTIQFDIGQSVATDANVTFNTIEARGAGGDLAAGTAVAAILPGTGGEIKLLGPVGSHGEDILPAPTTTQEWLPRQGWFIRIPKGYASTSDTGAIEDVQFNSLLDRNLQITTGNFGLHTRAHSVGGATYGNILLGANIGKAGGDSYGTYNIFIGDRVAGAQSNLGNGNIGIGTLSLFTLNGGGGNTCIGYQAGYHLNSGKQNVYIGRYAGYGWPHGTSQGQNKRCTYIGTFAGHAGTAPTTNGSIAIGYNTGPSSRIGNRSNELWIDAGSKDDAIMSDIIGPMVGAPPTWVHTPAKDKNSLIYADQKSGSNQLYFNAVVGIHDAEGAGTGEIRFYDAGGPWGAGPDYIAIKAPDAIPGTGAQNYTITLPPEAPSADAPQVLVSQGGGVMAWEDSAQTPTDVNAATSTFTLHGVESQSTWGIPLYSRSSNATIDTGLRGMRIPEQGANGNEITYRPDTGVLTAPKFSGDGSLLTNVAYAAEAGSVAAANVSGAISLSNNTSNFLAENFSTTVMATSTHEEFTLVFCSRSPSSGGGSTAGSGQYSRGKRVSAHADNSDREPIFIPALGQLTVKEFVGAFSGDGSDLTNVPAHSVTVTGRGSSNNEDYHLIFASGQTATTAAKSMYAVKSNSGANYTLKFNPAHGRLSCRRFSGDGGDLTDVIGRYVDIRATSLQPSAGANYMDNEFHIPFINSGVGGATTATVAKSLYSSSGTGTNHGGLPLTYHPQSGELYVTKLRCGDVIHIPGGMTSTGTANTHLAPHATNGTLGLCLVSDTSPDDDIHKGRLWRASGIANQVSVPIVKANGVTKLYSFSQVCFLPGTKITLSNNIKINIENLKRGDKLLSYKLNDMEPYTKSVDVLSWFSEYCEGEFSESEVSNIWSDKSPGYIILNDNLHVTDEHLIFTKVDDEYTWLSAKDIQEGDIVFTDKGEYEEITKIEKVREEVTVYNLRVNSPAMNYFASSYLVHNASLCVECAAKNNKL